MPCDPLRDLRAWQERLERLAAQRGGAWDPPIDVYETAARYVVTAELPGLTRDEIELAVQDNRLTIRGVRPGAGPESPARHYHRSSAAMDRSSGRSSSSTPSIRTA